MLLQQNNDATVHDGEMLLSKCEELEYKEAALLTIGKTISIY